MKTTLPVPPPARSCPSLPCLLALLAFTLLGAYVRAAEPAAAPPPPVMPEKIEVSDIKAVCRNGQTFVTFKDAAEGETGALFRYSLYRADQPITPDTFERAELCYSGVLNNSAKLFGAAFNQDARKSPDSPKFELWQQNQLAPTSMPTFIIEEGGQPLPMWSGLAVRTVDKDRPSYYAVVATDVAGKILSRIVPGASATVTPVDEKVAPIQPIKLLDSKAFGRYRDVCKITGAKGLPLTVSLHASSGQGGGAGSHGDYYIYFATPQMGWRDGLPGVFSVEERRGQTDKSGYLILNSRDAIEHPDGKRAMETYWFGYFCQPQGVKSAAPRAWPFTENRMLWVIDWVARRYEADASRITAGGGSMGAWGSSTFAFRHPEVFAAVYPDRPRTRQKGMPSLSKLDKGEIALMPDDKTPYLERMDMVKFASEHPGDLPFYCWGCGRRDGFATFQEQIDMVKALTAAHHGFAFAWNDGDHSSGSAAIGKLKKWYGPEKFARNQSYPAFGNSSLDHDLALGEGDAKKDPQNLPVYMINAGFTWSNVVDEAGAWSVALGNELCQEPMTVDVTPRRCQKFRAQAGGTYAWNHSAGGQGEVVADAWGLITIPRVTIKPGAATVLTVKPRE